MIDYFSEIRSANCNKLENMIFLSVLVLSSSRINAPNFPGNPLENVGAEHELLLKEPWESARMDINTRAANAQTGLFIFFYRTVYTHSREIIGERVKIQ